MSAVPIMVSSSANPTPRGFDAKERNLRWRKSRYSAITSPAPTGSISLSRPPIKKTNKTQAYPNINDYVNALYDEAIKIVDSVGGMDLIRGIGAGVPNGNYYTGMIEGAMNLPWQSVPFAQLMTDRFGVPCKITNDANAAAMGEMTYGAAKGMKLYGFHQQRMERDPVRYGFIHQ